MVEFAAFLVIAWFAYRAIVWVSAARMRAKKALEEVNLAAAFAKLHEKFPPQPDDISYDEQRRLLAACDEAEQTALSSAASPEDAEAIRAAVMLQRLRIYVRTSWGRSLVDREGRRAFGLPP